MARKKPVSGREPTRGEERELLSGCFEAEASGRTQLPSANRPIVDNVSNCDPDSQSQKKSNSSWQIASLSVFLKVNSRVSFQVECPG